MTESNVYHELRDSCANQPCLDSDIHLTFAQRFSDLFASFVGSWLFINGLVLLLVVWFLINIYFVDWDVYPFILMNLLLSFIAAYSTPIIMMSQNRVAEVERIRESSLQEKVDQIRLSQMLQVWDELVEQTNLLLELHAKLKESKSNNLCKRCGNSIDDVVEMVPVEITCKELELPDTIQQTTSANSSNLSNNVKKSHVGKTTKPINFAPNPKTIGSEDVPVLQNSSSHASNFSGVVRKVLSVTSHSPDLNEFSKILSESCKDIVAEKTSTVSMNSKNIKYQDEINVISLKASIDHMRSHLTAAVTPAPGLFSYPAGNLYDTPTNFQSNFSPVGSFKYFSYTVSPISNSDNTKAVELSSTSSSVDEICIKDIKNFISNPHNMTSGEELKKRNPKKDPYWEWLDSCWRNILFRGSFVDDEINFGDKVAVLLSEFVGSWTFVITQSLVLAVWLLLNSIDALNPFDPYPYILLNLALSTQAAFAAPIIMMSQNRCGDIDKIRSIDVHSNLDHIRMKQVLAIGDALSVNRCLLKKFIDNI